MIIWETSITINGCSLCSSGQRDKFQIYYKKIGFCTIVMSPPFRFWSWIRDPNTKLHIRRPDRKFSYFYNIQEEITLMYRHSIDLCIWFLPTEQNIIAEGFGMDGVCEPPWVESWNYENKLTVLFYPNNT